MASLQTHRKLLSANSTNSNSTTPTDPTVQTCLYFCNSQSNTTSPYSGFCPLVCLAICPSQCHYPFSLSPEFPPSKPNKSQNISPLLISMLVLLASAFLLITLYILYTRLYYYYFYAPNSNSFLQTRTGRRRRRRRGESAGNYSMDEEHGNRVVFHPFWYISTAGLPPAEIQSIPIHKYGKEMEERDCGVCLTEFEEGDELRVLPKCNHAFHIPCIDTWLSSHTTCPLCRTPIIPPDDHNRDHDHNHKNEDTSSSLASVEGATEDNSPAEVLNINIRGVEEETEYNLEDEDHTENTRNKDQEIWGIVVPKGGL